MFVNLSRARPTNGSGRGSLRDHDLTLIVQHFNDEEAILAQNHYADLNDHVRAHKALVTRELQIHSQVLDGGVTIGELVSFLADEVVAQHMLKVDRKFFPLFNEIKSQ